MSCVAEEALAQIEALSQEAARPYYSRQPASPQAEAVRPPPRARSSSAHNPAEMVSVDSSSRSSSSSKPFLWCRSSCAANSRR